MKNLRRLSAVFLLVLATSTVRAADLECGPSPDVEEFRYSWRLKGGIRFLAGLMFPTSGTGNLKTVFPRSGEQSINSELTITAPKSERPGYFSYQSQMDTTGRRTLVTNNGYAWGEKSRRERTVFDYVKRLTRIHRETPEKTEDRVKPMPPAETRDVLTAIYYLRQNAHRIVGPLETSIYVEGKEYPVVFQPVERRTFLIDKRNVAAIGFEIVDAPGGKKWPGGVKVWLSDDDRRIPFRIELQQSIASLQLDLQSIESCIPLRTRG